MTKEIRVFAKGREITVDGKKVKTFDYSYTPNGKKFFKIIFETASKPNNDGMWIVKVDSKNLSPKKGKPMYNKKTGLPVCSKKTGEQLIENDIIFIKDLISLKYDEEYEKIREERREEQINAIFSLENEEELPFQN